MNEKEAFDKLHQLQEMGEEILLQDRKGIRESSALTIWLAGVNDILMLILPKGSFLIEELHKIRKGELESDRRKTKKELEGTIARVIQICAIAKLYLAQTPEEVLERQGIEEFIENQKKDLELKQKEFERQMKELVSKKQEFEREINNNIISGYFKSWWFRVPIAILIVAVIFVVTGTYQIGQYKIDIRDLANNAVEKTKQDILTQTEDIIESINTFSGEEKDRIKKTADSQIEEIVQYNTANTNVIELWGRLDTLEEKVGTLEMKLPPLSKAAETINNSSPTLLDEAGLLLTNSALITLGILGMSGLSLVLSIINIFRRNRERS